MRSWYAIVAQAIGVAALAGVVYLAFLQPDDSGPLSGIDIEDGQIAAPPPGVPGKPVRGDGRPARKRATPRRGPVLTAVDAPGATATAFPDVQTPPGSQYSDTVARILGLVSRSEP